MVLERLERDAREGRKVLWADPQPVPPWEWRKKTQGIVVSVITIFEADKYFE
jgi:endonuclease YncB( thermonuclease family)